MTDIDKQEVKSKAAKYNSEMSGKQYKHNRYGGNYRVSMVNADVSDFVIRCSFERLFVNKNSLVEEIDVFLRDYSLIE